MEEECEFCQEKFEHTQIKKYDNWTVNLFLNQYYLGRCLIKLNRHTIDLFEITREERKELFETVIPELKQALNKSFSPDLYNYLSLGNDCRHLHIHLIPRYSSEREFKGKTFTDENWNSNYTPYPADFTVSENLFESIRSKIEEELD